MLLGVNTPEFREYINSVIRSYIFKIQSMD